MIHIKIELEAMNETWRISQILIDKDGEPYLVRHSEETFPTKELAEHDAQHQARRFSKATSVLGMEILSGRYSLLSDANRAGPLCQFCVRRNRKG